MILDISQPDPLYDKLLGSRTSLMFQQRAAARYDYLKGLEPEFNRLFPHMDMLDFVNHTVGFDTVKLLDTLVPVFQDGVSYNQRLLREYGEEAFKLEEQLRGTISVGREFFI